MSDKYSARPLGEFGNDSTKSEPNTPDNTPTTTVNSSSGIKNAYKFDPGEGTHFAASGRSLDFYDDSCDF